MLPLGYVYCKLYVINNLDNNCNEQGYIISLFYGNYMEVQNRTELTLFIKQMGQQGTSRDCYNKHD